MAETVLDSSAVLAWLNSENGSANVGALISTASLSAVNLSEVVAKLIDGGKSGDLIRRSFQGLPCEIVDFDAAQAMAAGLMRSTTRQLGLSFGDRACLALAATRGLPVWTADRAWAKVDVGVDVRLIR